jgi:hypothetical protein
MKTYLECFKEVRQQFIESNPGIVSRIEYEANQHAPNLGLSEKEFFDDEIGKLFISELARHGGDPVLTVIRMSSADDETKNTLQAEHYQTIADALGMPLNEYLIENRIIL